MAVRRVFLLTSGRLTAYHWDGGRPREPFAFEADEKGLTQFAQYLDEQPEDPVYLVADVVEEEFREETIPHVLGGDRRALLRTKSNRLFRDARYTHSMLQGREPDGRRDDRVLFSALIRPDLLAPWLGQIARHKVPLAGVYSLPVLSGGLMKAVPASGDSVLLVTLQSSGGLRQTFFKQQQLKLSRLALMPYLEPGQYASYILAEVEKIRRYLNSLRMVSRDSPLEVYVLSHGGMLEDLERQASDSVATNYHFVDVARVAARLGIKGRHDTPYSDQVFVQLVGKQAPVNHYANAEETRYFSMYRARGLMKVASLLLFVGSLVYGGLKFVEGVIASEQTRAIARQTAFYDQRYREARERLPKTPAEPRELELVVKAASALRGRRASPVDMMVRLSSDLANFPTLKVYQIDWKRALDPEAPVGGRRSRPQPHTPTFAPPPPAPPPEPGVQYQLALLTGGVAPFDGDYRAAIDTINEFADALTAGDDVAHVRIMSLPLDLSSQETLKGDAGRTGREATFELRVAVRMDVPALAGE